MPKKKVVETPPAAAEQAVKIEGQEMDVSGGARESLYDQYAKSQEAPAEVVKSGAEPSEEPEVEDSRPASPAVPEIQEAKKEPPEEPKIKTVPYDALHAEREKRKAAQATIRELEDKLRGQKAVPDGPIEDYESEIKELKRTTLDLQRQLQEQRSQAEKRVSQEMVSALQSRVAQTASELKAEGFPLFGHLQYQVAAEIGRLVDEAEEDDKDLVIRQWDNPTGWKKIYKERIFPAMQSEIAGHQKSGDGEQKRDLKAQAQLSGSPGMKPGGEKAEKEWTVQDYFAERRKNNISGLNPLGE